MAPSFSIAAQGRRKQGRRILRAAQFCAIVALSAIATMIWPSLPTTIQWRTEIKDYLLVIAITGVANVMAISAATAAIKAITRDRATAARQVMTAIANRDPTLRNAYPQVGPYLWIGEPTMHRDQEIPMHPATAKAIMEAIPAWLLALNDTLYVTIEPPFASATMRATHEMEFTKWLSGEGGASA